MFIQTRLKDTPRFLVYFFKHSGGHRDIVHVRGTMLPENFASSRRGVDSYKSVFQAGTTVQVDTFDVLIPLRLQQHPPLPRAAATNP